MASLVQLPLPSPQFGEDGAAPSFSIKPGTFGYVPKNTNSVPWYSKSQDYQPLRGISHGLNSARTTCSAAGKTSFFCDACNRDFNSPHLYREHIAGHEKCSVKGCPYVAAPKLVEMHYKMQHRTGLAEKIWKADIAKWQAERRRNYPTAANIARKEAERQARTARGEVLETKSFGKMRQKNRFGAHKRSYNEADLQHKSSTDTAEVTPATTTVSKPVHVLGSTLAVPVVHHPASSKEGSDPLSLLLTNADGGRQTSERDREHVAPSPGLAVGELPTGLLALAVQYAGSDTEEEGEIRDDDNDDIVSTATPPVAPAASCRSAPDMKKLPLKTKARSKCLVQKPNRRKPTLLEQLLAAEIRKERNAILQCIRYVVNNGFLQQKQQDHKSINAVPAAAPAAQHVADDDTWE